MKAADRAYHLQDGEIDLVENRSTANAHSDETEDDTDFSGKTAIVPGTGG